MSDAEINAITRSALSRRRIPDGSACADCNGTTQLARASDGAVRCYACTRVLGGAAPREDDHIAGRRNLGGIVVALRPNDHREITEARLRLGIDEWPDANGDPLRQLGHLLAGLGTLLVLLGRWLMELADHAAARMGHGWWTLAPALPVAS